MSNVKSVRQAENQYYCFVDQSCRRQARDGRTHVCRWSLKIVPRAHLLIQQRPKLSQRTNFDMSALAKKNFCRLRLATVHGELLSQSYTPETYVSVRLCHLVTVHGELFSQSYTPETYVSVRLCHLVTVHGELFSQSYTPETYVSVRLCHLATVHGELFPQSYTPETYVSVRLCHLVTVTLL